MRLGTAATGRRPAAVLLSIALSICAPDGLAQSSERARDQEGKQPRTGSRDQSTAERERHEREERVRQERTRVERDRSERERQQRERHDRERQAREQAERRATQQRSHPAPPPASRAHEEDRRQRASSPSPDAERRRENRTPAAPPPAAVTPGPYSVPRNSHPVAPRAATASVRCSAHPQCNSATGYGNVCRGVQGTYAGTYALDDGMRDIVNRCRSANSPDPCGADARGSQSSTDFRLAFGGGCLQQCASAARCTPGSVR